MKPLTKRDMQTLNELFAANADQYRLSKQVKLAFGNMVTPLDCGGFNGSHHSATLSKLVRHGFAISRKFGSPGCKGSKLYEVSPEGAKLVIANLTERSREHYKDFVSLFEEVKP